MAYVHDNNLLTTRKRFFLHLFPKSFLIDHALHRNDQATIEPMFPTLQVKITVRKEHFTLHTSLTMHSPCIMAVWGKSGCGKTTLLRAVAGLDPVENGMISVNGAVWNDTEKAIHCPPYRRHVGYVFQEAGLFPHLSVKKNLLYGFKRSQCVPPKLTPDRVIELLHLHDLLSRKPSSLSGGQKQRVAIGRALLAQPEIMLLDEPVGALDHESRSCILQLLSTIKEMCRIPMIYVTHHIDEVARLADRICIMENGVIIDEGTKVAMMRKIYRRNHDNDASFNETGNPFSHGNDCPYDLFLTANS